jgi:RND family efflux transporter MFP subunit
MAYQKIAILLATVLGLGAVGSPEGSAAEVEAITQPGSDVTLSFVRPGKVVEVLVKEGQAVTQGQILARQDDSAEQAQLAQLKAQAEDTTRTRAAKATLDQRNVDLKKIRWAADQGAATELEVAHAKLEVTIAELSLELAEFEHQQNKLKYEEVKLQVERMRLTSPIAGKVERVFLEMGESVDALKDVIRVVNIDPLWVEVHVPVVHARNLGAGQKATVVFKSDGWKAQGTILHMGAVAEPASETITVRVEVPNGEGRPAGQRVNVSFIEAAGNNLRAERSAEDATVKPHE